MIIPANYDIEIIQGGTFDLEFTYSIDGTAVNLTGYTARMDIRTSTDASDAIVSLTTENGGLTITALQGKIAILITASQTTAMTFTPSVYDLYLFSGSYAMRLVEGAVALSPRVTR